MYKYTTEELTTIRKLQQRVRKFYPEANLEKTDEGYTIIDADHEDILAEYMLPMGKTPVEAWQLAILTAKTTKNFNRTHPERLSIELEEEKTRRGTRRTKRI